MTSSREQFEWWVRRDTGLDLFRTNYPMKLHDQQDYKDINTNLAWMAWQASRQCIEVALPEVEDPANFFCEVYDTFKIQQALTVAGIKIKGA